MPESSRIDVYRDLPADVAPEVQAEVERLVELERQWIESGDEAAYREWRDLANKVFAKAKEHQGLDGGVDDVEG